MYFQSAFSATFKRPNFFHTARDALYEKKENTIRYHGSLDDRYCGKGRDCLGTTDFSLRFVSKEGDTVLIDRESIVSTFLGLLEVGKDELTKLRDIDMRDGFVDIVRDGEVIETVGFLQEKGQGRINRRGFVLLGDEPLIIDEKYLLFEPGRVTVNKETFSERADWEDRPYIPWM